MVQRQARPNLELEVLIASGTLALSAVQRSFISQITVQPFDWALLFKLARNHRLVGVVNHHLRNGVFRQVPANVLNDFATSSKNQGRNNLWLTTVLFEVMTALKRNGIPAIFYKGPILAEQLYGDLEMRASTDLDVIVPEQDVPRTRDCLAEMGFEDGYGLDRTQQQAAFHFGFEHSFTRSGLKLDLHWRIAPHWAARSLDMDAIFGRANLKSFFGTECLCLRNEDLVVALCVHAAQHEWGQLSQFVDILEILRRTPQLDWDLIRNQMVNSQMERILLICLKVVSMNWDVELPDWCRESIQRRPTVNRTATMARRTWTSSAWPNQGRLGLLGMTDGEKLRDRVAILVGVVLEPKIPDVCALRLRPGAWWLYWLFRPLRLLWKRVHG